MIRFDTLRFASSILLAFCTSFWIYALGAALIRGEWNLLFNATILELLLIAAVVIFSTLESKP